MWDLDETIDVARLKDARKKTGCTYGAVEQIALESFEDEHRIEKVGFARSVIDVFHELSVNHTHLWSVLNTFIDYYNTARPHQGLAQKSRILHPLVHNSGPVQ